MKKLHLCLSLLFLAVGCYGSDATGELVWQYAAGELSDDSLSLVLESVEAVDMSELHGRAHDCGYETFYHFAVVNAPAQIAIQGAWEGAKGRRGLIYSQQTSDFIVSLLKQYVVGQKRLDGDYVAAQDSLLSELLSFASAKGKIASVSALRKVGADFAWSDGRTVDDVVEAHRDVTRITESRVIADGAVEHVPAMLDSFWKLFGI